MKGLVASHAVLLFVAAAMFGCVIAAINCYLLSITRRAAALAATERSYSNSSRNSLDFRAMASGLPLRSVYVSVSLHV
jgi:hypothetical protein